MKVDIELDVKPTRKNTRANEKRRREALQSQTRDAKDKEGEENDEEKESNMMSLVQKEPYVQDPNILRPNFEDMKSEIKVEREICGRGAVIEDDDNGNDKRMLMKQD